MHDIAGLYADSHVRKYHTQTLLCLSLPYDMLVCTSLCLSLCLCLCCLASKSAAVLCKVLVLLVEVIAVHRKHAYSSCTAPSYTREKNKVTLHCGSCQFQHDCVYLTCMLLQMQICHAGLLNREKLAGMPVPMSMRRVKQAQHSHQLLDVAAGTGGNTFSTAT